MKTYWTVAVALSLALTAANASAQTCGNGVVDGGEACDVAATLSGHDECGDGCGSDCTLLEECGVADCEDGDDNDADGLVDSEDPDCTTLLELQPLAVVGTNTTSLGARMGLLSQVESCNAAGVCGVVSGRSLATTEPYPFGDSKADFCVTRIQMENAVIEGSLTVLDSAKILGRNGYSGIGNYYVADNGALPDMDLGYHPTVGLPLGLCSSDGMTACLFEEHCPLSAPSLCENRLLLSDPLNTSVDLLGTGVGASHLADCNTAMAALNTLADEVSSLGDGSGTDLSVAKKGTDTIGPLSSGPNVFNFNRISVGKLATLTIDGPADASFVAVVSSRLKLSRGAVIQLTGGIEPRNVLFTFVGDNSNVFLSREASITGSLLAPGRSRIRMGWDSTVEGSAFSRYIFMKERSRVLHTPFTGLLPTNLEIVGSDSPDPVTAGNQLTYSFTVRNNGIAWAPAVTVTDTLDSGVKFVSVSSSKGSCVHDGSGTGGDVTCFLGSLADAASAPDDEATISITVQVNCDARVSVSNTATVQAETAELDPADNTVNRTTTVNEDAVLDVSVSDSVDPVEEGTGLNYTITVQNTGASSCARTVNIADTLPAALVGESVSIAPGSVPSCAAHLTCTASCPGNAFPCGVTILPPGQTVTISVTGGTVANGTGVLGSTTELSNTASVTGPDGTDNDTETTDVLRNQGDSCSGGTGADCVTSQCIDGFCCGSVCGGTCEACNISGSEGTCTGIAVQTDPVNECGALCSVCDGNGGSGGGACIPASNGTDPNNNCAAASQDSCDFDGQCDGAGACRFWAPGTACLSQADTACSNPNTCDGTGTCLENHEPNTTSCTGSSQGGVCDDDAADHCNGSVDACVDVFKPAVTTCRSSSGQCDVAEQCTGVSGSCPADVFKSNVTSCTGSSQSGVCDNDAADHCSGSADACVDVYQPAVTTCRSSAGQCDVAEQCTGASGACPSDAFQPNTTSCTGSSQGGVCDNDAADTCSGTANTCNDAYKSASTTCRSSAGQCDAAEQCTGASGSCPTDAFQPNTTSCTGSSQGGVCDNDAADLCSGTANTCNDAYQSASTTCRSSAGQCDAAEQCTGASGACPTDAFQPNTTSCTGSSQGGVCDDDAADACSGTANTCNDVYKSASTTCRSSAGQCDAAEQCTGASGACPTDAFQPNTTSCTGSSQGGVCDDDAADACSGTANTCNDVYKSAVTTCRSSSGQCDVAEQCTGASGSCPADGYEADGTPCTPPVSGICASGVCTPTFLTCTGGTVTDIPGYRVHTFSSSDTLDCSGGGTVEYLIVGGGGGGGSGRHGAGGGAGGLRAGSVAVSGTSYAVTVGSGGGGGAFASAGSDGGSSSFNGIVSLGGGGGGTWWGGTIPGHSGGSGGGSSIGAAAGTGTVGQGNDGGTGPNAPTAFGGGGGGGAGAVGGAGSGSVGGDGGAGLASSISGSAVTYAGGGGGSTYNGNGTPGAGGSGGGASGVNTGNGNAATANTGGGGGGSGTDGSSGGAGGSGIVVVRYAM